MGIRADLSFATIHGMFSTSLKHAQIRDEASKCGFHIHDKSFEHDRRNPEIRDYADNKRQVIDHLNSIPRKHLVLCGHSKGGLLVQDIKDEDLDGKEIIGRVLVNSAAPRGINPVRNWTQRACILTQLPQLLTGTVKPPAFFAKRLLYNAHDSLGLEYDPSTLIPEPVPVFLDVAHYRVPVTSKPNVRVIGASEDMITPPVVQEEIARYHDAPPPKICAGHDHGSVFKVKEAMEIIMASVLELV